jgi:hypothetical protein
MSGIYASLRQAQVLILKILNVWMPVPLYLSGAVNPADSGTPSLILHVPRLPIPLAAGQWHFAVFVPDNSGGPVLDFNEVPY